MLTVVLVEPETPGNVGSVARVMKNFGVKNLILINPKCNHLDGEAKGRAMHGRDILQGAKKSRLEVLKTFDVVAATTSRLGSDYNIPRIPLTPAVFAEKIKAIKGNIALVFGREDTGLTNQEIMLCDFVVSIPASSKYSALNISHAAGIILYELFKRETFSEKFPSASGREKDVILKNLYSVLECMEFQTDGKRETQKKLWRRIVGKAMLTKREAFALMGFIRQLKKMISR